MNVLIYLRKSREDAEKEKRTGEDILAVHRGRLVSLCEKLGHTYTIREEVVSGDIIASRPEFQKVLYEDMPSGIYQAIAVNEIPRLSRGNMKDAGETYQAIIDYNTKIITPHKIYNPKNRSDLRHLRFELFLSREEFETIRDRLEDGRDAAAKAGRAANNIYTLGLKTVRGDYEIDEKGLEIARLIYTMTKDGKSLTGIADYLNSVGHRTARGKLFNRKLVRQVLKNMHYEGFQEWKGETYPAQHGPLLPPDLIFSARERLISIDTQTSRRNLDFWAPLICAKCGRKMHGLNKKYRHKEKEYRYPIYICDGRNEKPSCYNVAKVEHVHTKIENTLRSITRDRSLQKKLIEQRKVIDTSSLLAEAKSLREKIKNIESNNKRIKDDYFNGSLKDVNAYNEAMRVHEGQIKIIQARLRELEPQLRINRQEPRELIKKLERLMDEWDKLPNKIKLETVSEFTESIIFDGKTKDLLFKLRLPL